MSFNQHSFVAIDGTQYFVMQSCAKMPSSVKAPYKHSAVVRVDANAPAPKQIRNTKTATVLWDSGPGFDGRTQRCAAYQHYSHAFDLAEEYCEKRNARIRAKRTAAYVESLQERSGECAA